MIVSLNFFLIVLAYLLTFSKIAVGQIATTRPENPPPKTQELYVKVFNNAKIWNGDGRSISDWDMSPEHLFLGMGESPRRHVGLMYDAVAVSRADGGLDLLYSKIENENTSDYELLVISELLVYYGQYDCANDDKVVGHFTRDVRTAIASGRLQSAEKRFPLAPLRQKIERALQKSDSVVLGKGELGNSVEMPTTRP